MDETELDAVLSVLAHSGRRRMLDLVMGTPGMSVKALASHFDCSRIAVLKHVQLLEEVGLLISRFALHLTQYPSITTSKTGLGIC